MTKTLTEQWRAGNLKKSFYYLKFPNTETTEISNLYDMEKFRYVQDSEKIEVLDEVPSYEEYNELATKCNQLQKRFEIDTKALKKYGYYNKMTTTCDICGKEIIGIENFIDAGDKVVCSENCKQTAIAEFRHWQETESHNWRKP